MKENKKIVMYMAIKGEYGVGDHSYSFIPTRGGVDEYIANFEKELRDDPYSFNFEADYLGIDAIYEDGTTESVWNASPVED